MACYKKTKNGDVVSWPCGKKKDGHVFGSNFGSGANRARNYEESPADKAKRKQRTKDNKSELKDRKKSQKKREKYEKLREKNPDKLAKKQDAARVLGM